MEAGSASTATPDHEVTIEESATEVDVIEVFSIAADEVVASGGKVYVRFEHVRP